MAKAKDGKVTYRVSLSAQDEVNDAIKEGGDGDGLFNGGIEVTELNELEKVLIDVVCGPLEDDEDIKTAGKKTFERAHEQIPEGAKGLLTLDYIAGAKAAMSKEVIPVFVNEGVRAASKEQGIPLAGGESAQMEETYHKGERDAYVHVIYLGNKGRLDIKPFIKDMKKPLLRASTDGTGTKTKIRRNPADILHHGCNDIVATGAKPIAFVPYIAGNVPREELEAILSDAQQLCDEMGIQMLSTGVYEKPDTYLEGEVDVAGTVIGVVDDENLITGENVEEDDVIIGIASNGLMTNGYTLARDCCESNGYDWDEEGLPGLEGTTIKAEMGAPHVPYVDILLGDGKSEGILSKYAGKVHATAHITGGGQKGNIKRMMPDGLCAVVQKEVLPVPPIMKHFRETKVTTEEEMYSSLNMGVGFTITVSADIADEVVAYINENFRHSTTGYDRQAAKIGVVEEAKFHWRS